MPDVDRRDLARRHRDHRLVEEREAPLDLAQRDQRLALAEARDRVEIGIVVSIRRRRDLIEERERFGGPALIAGPERLRDEQHRALDAVRAASPASSSSRDARACQPPAWAYSPCSPKLITRKNAWRAARIGSPAFRARR